MDIYLDTSHLQKWQQETLPESDIRKLNNLRNSGNHTFVLSLAHISDITNRDDKRKAIAVARFLDQLSKKWLKNPVDLEREEIINAIKYFKKKRAID